MSEFSRASEVLSTYYGLLERQVRELKLEVEQRGRELERSRNELRLILDCLPLGVCLFEGERLLFSNRYARELKGEDVVREIAGQEGGQGKLRKGRSVYRWKKAEIADGYGVKRIFVFEDVTELEKTQEKGELDRRLVAMGEMALRIAHEIKNPLSSIEIFLSMLRKGRNKKYADYAMFGVKTIERIINNLLAYTRPRNATLRHGVLSELVKETLEFMRASLDPRGIKLEFESSFEAPTLFDPDLMRLVIMNLVANARDAICSKGRIQVRLKEEGDYLVLTVADDGEGMEEGIKKDIFSPFFTTKEKGLGLGLFIVYNVVNAHKGFVDVESRKGEGTAFHIYIPKGER